MALTIKGLEQDVYYMNNNIFVELEETEDFDMFHLIINGSIAYELTPINNKLRLNLSSCVKSYLGILDHDNDVKNISILFQSVKRADYPEALIFTADGGVEEITGAVNVFDDPLNPIDATHWYFEYKLMSEVDWSSYQIPYVPFQSTFYQIPDVTPPGIYSVRVMLIGDNGKRGIWKQIDDVIVT